MSDQDELRAYYAEFLDDPRALTHGVRKHFRLLLDYLLANGYMVLAVKTVVTGWHCHGEHNLVISGECFDEEQTVYTFKAYYKRSANWQVPGELENELDEVELL